MEFRFSSLSHERLRKRARIKRYSETVRAWPSPNRSADHLIRRLPECKQNPAKRPRRRAVHLQLGTSGSSAKSDHLKWPHLPNRTDECVTPLWSLTALFGNLGSPQMRNVQRSSGSGLDCRCVAIDIDSTDVRILSPAQLNDLGRMIEILMGGVNFIHGATGILWLTGVSISLNAVSGLSAMGMTEMKITAVTTTSRNVHLLRFTTLRTPMA